MRTRMPHHRRRLLLPLLPASEYIVCVCVDRLPLPLPLPLPLLSCCCLQCAQMRPEEQGNAAGLEPNRQLGLGRPDNRACLGTKGAAFGFVTWPGSRTSSCHNTSLSEPGQC